MAEETIINLLLHLDPTDIVNFFKPEAYPEFDYLLEDNYFLHELSVVNKVPNINNLRQLIEYYNLSLDERLRVAIINGDMEAINRMCKLGAIIEYWDINDRLYRSIKHDRINMIRFLIKEDPNTSRALKYASREGFIDLVQMLIDESTGTDTESVISVMMYRDIIGVAGSRSTSNLGIKDFNITMRIAARGAHMNIIVLMLNLGANDFNSTMKSAAEGQHINIIKLMLSLGANNYNEVMRKAIGTTHNDLNTNIVRLMLEMDADDVNEALWMAVSVSNIDIIKLLVEYGASNYDAALSEIIELGRRRKSSAQDPQIIIFLISLRGVLSNRKIKQTYNYIKHEFNDPETLEYLEQIMNLRDIDCL